MGPAVVSDSPNVAAAASHSDFDSIVMYPSACKHRPPVDESSSYWALAKLKVVVVVVIVVVVVVRVVVVVAAGVVVGHNCTSYMHIQGERHGWGV